jgi:hypothetical protein
MDLETAAGVSAAFIIINSCRKIKRHWWKKEFLSENDSLMSEFQLNEYY